MCLCCFFNNYNQFQIRKGVQLRADRFEHYIEKYKLYFISKINDNLDKPLCDKHDNQDNKRLLNLIKEIVNKNEKDIYNFFDSLQQIYIWWINSESQKAIEKLHEVLKKYKIIETMKTDMVGSVLFRGRVANYPVSHWDMFHIPFNKRYLIGNQRYSLVGQPILYLATSPYCVAKELKTINNLKISSIVKNPYNLSNNIILFDNSNYISKLIRINDESVENMFLDNTIEEEKIKTYLFQFILSICCSFSVKFKSENYSFIEEYVLPQLLAQVVKKENINGIIFDSTQCLDNQALCSSRLYNDLSKNICIFTQYNYTLANDITYVYDKLLYKSLMISAPMEYSEVGVDEKFYDTEKTRQIINKILSEFEDKLSDNEMSELGEIVRSLQLLEQNQEYLEKIEESNHNLLNDSIVLHKIQLRNILLNRYDNLIKKFKFKEDNYGV